MHAHMHAHMMHTHTYLSRVAYSDSIKKSWELIHTSHCNDGLGRWPLVRNLLPTPHHQFPHQHRAGKVPLAERGACPSLVRLVCLLHGEFLERNVQCQQFIQKHAKGEQVHFLVIDLEGGREGGREEGREGGEGRGGRDGDREGHDASMPGSSPPSRGI